MSRSRKKTPIHPICCCRSQKKWKQTYNRRIRSHENVITRKLVKGDLDTEEVLFPRKKELSNIWLSPSDGKMYWDRPFWDDEHDYKRWIK